MSTRTTEYRGFQIHVELVQTSEDMFDLWFRIEGPKIGRAHV